MAHFLESSILLLPGKGKPLKVENRKLKAGHSVNMGLDELVPPICHSKVPSRLSKLKLPLKLTARKTCASSKEP